MSPQQRLEASFGQLCSEKIARGRAAFTPEDAREVTSGLKAMCQTWRDEVAEMEARGPLRGEVLLATVRKDAECMDSPFREGTYRCGQNYWIAGPCCIYPGSTMTGRCFRVDGCWVRPLNDGVAADLEAAGYQGEEVVGSNAMGVARVSDIPAWCMAREKGEHCWGGWVCGDRQSCGHCKYNRGANEGNKEERKNAT